jgi:putative nucleotidyltransferase with HDIG domain
MLKRIACDEVRLGVFIRSFEGSWLDHPFWRRSFVLDDPRDVEKVRRSDVTAVIIDIARGADVADATSVRVSGGPVGLKKASQAPVRPPRPSHTASSIPPEDSPLAARLLTEPGSAAEEVARATRLVRKSKGAVVKMFSEARLGKAIRTADVAPLVDEIAASVARNPSALMGVVRLKSKDEYTYLHSVAVAALMINFGRHLELDEAVVRDLGMAGLLHDIGKMAIPDAILNKPGPLTDAEFDLVRHHAERGHELLVRSGDVPEIALDVCLHHHEKIDGTGYPHGLAGDQISLYARMGAICDVYDAITSSRAYKEAWNPGDALARMIEWRGHFDEELLSKFLRSIAIYPTGMLVRLRSNRLAVVLGATGRDLTRPRVRAFYSIMEKEMISPDDVLVSTTLKGDQIISREVPAQWGFGDWSAMASALIAGEPLAEHKAMAAVASR